MGGIRRIGILACLAAACAAAPGRSPIKADGASVDIAPDALAVVDEASVDAPLPVDVSAADGTTTYDALALPVAVTWTGGFVAVGSFDLALGPGDLSPGWPAAFPAASSGLLADVSGDGKADLAVFTEGGAWRVDVTGGPSLSGQWPAAVHAIAVTAGVDGHPLLLFAGVHVYGLRIEDGQAITVEPGIPDAPDVWRFALTVADVDQDGLLDLVLGRYQCQSPHPPQVLLARGDGAWLDAGDTLGVTGTGSQQAILVADLDLDGDLDVVLLHDGCNSPTTTQFFARNAGRGASGWPTFVRESPHPLYAFPKAAMPYASPMGVAVGDLDGDGRLDLLVANVGMSLSAGDLMKLNPDIKPEVVNLVRNNLLRGQADGSYVDVGLAAGVKTLLDPVVKVDMSAWSPGLFDFDRDGRLDIALANGPDRTAYFTNNRGPMRPVLLHGLSDGSFAEVSAAAGWPAPWPGMALSLGDIDGDGDDDVLLGGLGGQPVLLRNQIVHGRHGLRLRLHGTVSNPWGLDAIVRATTPGGSQVRLLGGTAAYTTMHEPVADFGLGAATAADVEIQWPSGYVQHLGAVAVDQTLDVTEPALLKVSARVVHATAKVTVHVQAYDAQGKPLASSSSIALVPPGVLGWSQPLACDATGMCQGELQRTGVIGGATSVFVVATVAGQTLRVAPRLTVLPE